MGRILDPRSKRRREEAEELSTTSGWPIVSTPTKRELHLAWSDDRWELRGWSSSGALRASVDWVEDLERVRSHRAPAQEPLAKALRSAKSGSTEPLDIIDATIGFARDALFLASLGHRVRGFERSPIVHFLVEDARRRALEICPGEPVFDAIAIELVDAVEGLASITEAPDVVLIDPMFPPKRKRSALPPKHIQLLQQAVGTDPDSAGLVSRARQVAKHRVVVKRPHHADALAPENEMLTSTTGKMVRFDVYRPLDAGQ